MIVKITVAVDHAGRATAHRVTKRKREKPQADTENNFFLMSVTTGMKER